MIVGAILANGVADFTFGGAFLWYLVKFVVSIALAFCVIMLGVKWRKSKNAKLATAQSETDIGNGMEIEMKFQVKTLPEISDYPKSEIEQGYLCTDPVIRIRNCEDRYILTYKSQTGIESSGLEARVNREIEVPLQAEAYQHLREKADNHLIRKSRYRIPLDDGHTAELDMFHGALEGLVFVEVEFEDEKAAAAFCPPDWFGDNVSQDKRYTNSFLSTCEDLKVFS